MAIADRRERERAARRRLIITTARKLAEAEGWDAYLDFARDNPAVYDAMFSRATTLPSPGRRGG